MPQTVPVSVYYRVVAKSSGAAKISLFAVGWTNSSDKG
jgi:hypothetical protein